MNIRPKKITKEDKAFWAFLEKKSAEAQAREQWKNTPVSLTGSRPKLKRVGMRLTAPP